MHFDTLECSTRTVGRATELQAADRKVTLKTLPERDDGEVIPTGGERSVVVHAAFTDAVAGTHRPGVREVRTYRCSRVHGAALRGHQPIEVQQGGPGRSELVFHVGAQERHETDI